MSNAEIIITPFFELWVVRFIMSITCFFERPMEMTRVLFVKIIRCQVCATSKPPLQYAQRKILQAIKAGFIYYLLTYHIEKCLEHLSQQPKNYLLGPIRLLYFKISVVEVNCWHHGITRMNDTTNTSCKERKITFGFEFLSSVKQNNSI